MPDDAAAAIIVVIVGASACGVPSGGGSGGLQTSSPVVATIPLGNFGTDVAVCSEGTRAYVPLQTGSVLALDLTGRHVAGMIISVIDTRTSAVVATVAVANEPRAIAVSPDGGTAYVTHSSPTCSVIDLRRVTGVPGT